MRVLAWVAAVGLTFGILSAPPARAEGERAGKFDLYVMALSWSANWCAQTGDMRNDPQCDAGRGLSFVLHGLWPEYEDEGWPSYCRTGESDPPRRLTAAQADVFGGAGLAFYQWKKHGRCSGLSAEGYYDAARAAFGSVTIPPVLAGLRRQVSLPADVVEEAFLEVNPQLSPDQLFVTCTAGMIQEVRICLTRDLSPRDCPAETVRACTLRDAMMKPVR
jgi:ribonuclease T2